MTAIADIARVDLHGAAARHPVSAAKLNVLQLDAIKGVRLRQFCRCRAPL
jgi:hypothetical protein